MAEQEAGKQPLTSPSCPDSAPAYPWRFCGCETLIFNDTDLRRWKRWSRGQTHGSCEEDSPGHVRRRPGKELKWRPLPSRMEPSASVRKTNGEKNANTGVCAALRTRWCSDRGFEVVKSPLGYLLDARMKDFPFNFYGNRFNLGLLFVAPLRTAAAVYPRKAAGCDMRSIRYGVDLLVRVVMWLNWRFYVIITAF